MSLWRDLGGIFMDRHAGHSRRDLIVSGVALLCVAIGLALLAQWLLRGGLSEGWDALFERKTYGSRRGRTAKAQTLLWLTIGGGVSGLLSALLGAVGLFSVALGVRTKEPTVQVKED